VTKRESESHPDLDLLAESVAGALVGPEAAGVEDHLASCLRCRIEAGRLRRFAEIERDDELSAEAEWPRARTALELAFRRRIAPAARPAWRAARARRALAQRSRWTSWWRIPAAAAAVVALAVVTIDRVGNTDRGDRSGGPMRGESPAAQPIAAEAPAGRLTAPPREFAWRAAEEFDAFVLEIFSPELDLVFSRSGITGTRYAVTDTILAALEPGRTYVWSVRGVRAFGSGAVSEPAWFSVPAARARD